MPHILTYLADLKLEERIIVTRGWFVGEMSWDMLVKGCIIVLRKKQISGDLS
jgi:hypothetical protein